MFGTAKNGANAYAKVGVETGVTSASPHKLIVMLFDGAILSVATALQHMKSGNIPAKGQSITKAISIIEDGLRLSLDKKAGGSIALNLDALYEYMTNRLLMANLQNDLQKLEEVQRLLLDLKDAWVSIDQPAAQATEPAVPPAPAYDALSPRAVNFAKA